MDHFSVDGKLFKPFSQSSCKLAFSALEIYVDVYLKR